LKRAGRYQDKIADLKVNDQMLTQKFERGADEKTCRGIKNMNSSVGGCELHLTHHCRNNLNDWILVPIAVPSKNTGLNHEEDENQTEKRMYHPAGK
jgi:hypothetical protein